MIVEREGDNAADPNALARFLDPLAVDPDVAGIDQCLRESPALQQADEEEEPVDPHNAVIASGAKQSRSALLDCFVAAFLAMTIISA